MMMMLKASRTLVRFSRACQQGQLWRRSAMAMGTKVDGGTNSGGVDHEGSSGATNPAAEREPFSDDMHKSYGEAYSTRSCDEGYGERYGEVVNVVLEKKHDTSELQQQGATGKRDQCEETVVNVRYDTSQEEHVEEKASRHSTKGTKAT